MALPPLNLQQALFYDSHNNVTVRTTVGSGGLGSDVNVTNFPAIQTVTGNVNVSINSVSVSNFPATQNVKVTGGNINVTSGSVTITNFPADPATGTNQAAEIAALGVLHADLNAALPPGTNSIGNVSINNVNVLSTSANQVTEIAALALIHTDLNAPLPPGTNYIGNVAPLDGTLVVSNGNVTLGASQWYDTTGYGSLSIQIVAIEAGTILIEGSNDGITSSPLYVYPVADFNYVDVINKIGLYTLKVSSKYVRYNVQSIQPGTTFGVYIIARSGQGPSAADAVSMAMSGEQNMPLNVNFKSGLKIDTASGALVLADAINPNPAGLMYQAVVNTITVIDTTGYNSLNITTMAYAGTVTASNDGITWVALSGLAVTGASTVFVTAVTATASFTFPCLARYIRLTCTTAGQFTAYLRQQIFMPNYLVVTNQSTNMAQVGGTATVTGGLAGTLGIGGGSAVNVAPTYNFLGVAGIDSAGLTRRVLSDAAGRLAITASNPNISATGITPTAASLGAILGTMQNTAAMNVQDTAQFEGQSIVELLALILVELKIANQQRYEMPYLLNNGVNNGMDPPEQFRLDGTIFTQ
jgi:hypothetical protein